MLGFLSNDFNQAGSEENIDACIDGYGITFQQFAVDKVKMPGAQPVWEWLSMQPAYAPVTWNFHKYLIARDGTLVKHYDRCSYPTTCNPPSSETIDPTSAAFQNWEVVVDIKTELAKPAP